MLHALGFLLVVATISAVMAWLADHPGTILLEWQGLRIETSVAFFIVFLILIAILSALTYHIIHAIRHIPLQLSGLLHERRQQKGYKALTRGMVAIAAGDANEARRQEKQVQILLNEPPLTMLLSAQTAQLNGDETAAKKFFQAMTEQSETEFLGVRGLLNQALSRDDKSTALTLAMQAYRIRPNSDRVANQLFNLQVLNRQWINAQITSKKQVKSRLIDKNTGRRRKAFLTLQQGLEAAESNNPETALQYFKDSYNSDPTFIPAVLNYTENLIEQKRDETAIQIIKKTWRTQPHPELVFPYWQGSKAKDGMAIMKATEILALENPDHPESLIALARAAIEAQLWGEARKHLTTLKPKYSDHNEARICRLWADLEKFENQNFSESQTWLTRALLANSDPTWVCAKCGHSARDWSGFCVNCDSFDSLSWTHPSPTSGDYVSAKPYKNPTLALKTNPQQV